MNACLKTESNNATHKPTYTEMKTSLYVDFAIFTALVLVYIRISFKRFKNIVASRKGWRDLSLTDWHWPSVPLLVIALGSLNLWRWNSELAVTVNTVTLILIAAVAIELIIWKRSGFNLDLTLGEYLRKKFLSVTYLDPGKLKLNPWQAAFMENVKKMPEKYFMEIFIAPGLELSDLTQAYRDYLLSCGHVLVRWKMPQDFRKMVEGITEERTGFFLSRERRCTDIMLHLTNYDRDTGLVTFTTQIPLGFE